MNRTKNKMIATTIMQTREATSTETYVNQEHIDAVEGCEAIVNLKKKDSNLCFTLGVSIRTSKLLANASERLQ